MLDLALLADIPWMRDALCAEPRYKPDVWFPIKGEGTSAAKAVCQQCAVRDACLAYAIREDIRDGVWGGATPAERKQLVKSGVLTPELIDLRDVVVLPQAG